MIQRLLISFVVITAGLATVGAALDIATCRAWGWTTRQIASGEMIPYQVCERRK